MVQKVCAISVLIPGCTFGIVSGDDSHPFTHTMSLCAAIHTLVSPSGARGSVIQEPNLDPDVLMVMGSLMPVSLPHAERKEVKQEHLEQHPVGHVD